MSEQPVIAPQPETRRPPMRRRLERARKSFDGAARSARLLMQAARSRGSAAPASARDLVRTRLDKSGGRIRLRHARPVRRLCRHRRQARSLLGLSHDPPQTLKVAADQAASGARPDLLDRNGEILATDVKTMSVFAEPRRIIDKDEAVELITAVLPDIDAKELARAPRLEQGLRLGQAAGHRQGAAGDFPSRPARRRLLAREQARLSQRPGRRPCPRLRRQGQYRHRRHGEISRQPGPDRSACRRLQHRSRQSEAGAACRSI